MKWGQPRTAAMMAALVLSCPVLSRADSEDTRQMIGGVLTAGPAATGLALSLAGVAAPNRDLWISGIALAGLGPSVGHLVNNRYAASLALLGVKSVGLGVMYEGASRDDFLDPKRPTDPQFWVGWLMFGLAAGAEVYLGGDDILTAQAFYDGSDRRPRSEAKGPERGWSMSPWVSRGTTGLAVRSRF